MIHLREILRSGAGDGKLRLLLLACTFLAVTFAHPTLSLRRNVYRYLVVLDITQSMNAPDYQLDGRPASRLGFAKEALHRALRDMPCGSQVGLSMFTAYRSFLLFEPVEVCANYSEISATLDRLDWRMAWAGNSEIAKGLHSGLHIAGNLDPKPALVFITDGHEAPPVNPRHQPQFDGRIGEVKGVIIGTGGPIPVPIPKRDMEGYSLGYWKAEEVMQTDPYSTGRQTGVPGERMVEADGSPVIAAKRTGNEHLSSLRETYLQELAHNLGLSYYRLDDADGLGDALRRPEFARGTPVQTDMRWVLAVLALIALLLVYVPDLRTSKK